MPKKRSIDITLFAFLMYLGGILAISNACLGKHEFAERGIRILGIIFGIVAIVIGAGSSNLKSWARKLLLYWAIIGVIVCVARAIYTGVSTPHGELADSIFGIVCGGLMIWFFNRKSVKEQFALESEQSHLIL